MTATTTMTTMTLTALLNIIANAEANAAFAANAGHMLPGGLNDKRRGTTRNNGYTKQHKSKGRSTNMTNRYRYNYQNRPKIR